MTATVFEQLTDQFRVALAAGGLSVQRHPARADWRPDDCPLVVVRRGVQQRLTPLEMTRTDHRLTVFVHCLVAGTDWETEADALHEQANRLIAADTLLASLGVECVSSRPTGAAGAHTIGELVCEYAINVQTNEYLEAL